MLKVDKKSYADNRRRNLEFNVGDFVFICVSPWKGTVRFKGKGKLAPRYIGPYEVIERIGTAAYRLDLPIKLSRIHNAFHVSMLRKYVSDSSYILLTVPIELKENLSYAEEPIEILDRKDQILRSRVIPKVKVLWRNQKVEEATWENEAMMREEYPFLFPEM